MKKTSNKIACLFPIQVTRHCPWYVIGFGLLKFILSLPRQSSCCVCLCAIKKSNFQLYLQSEITTFSIQNSTNNLHKLFFLYVSTYKSIFIITFFCNLFNIFSQIYGRGFFFIKNTYTFTYYLLYIYMYSVYMYVLVLNNKTVMV